MTERRRRHELTIEQVQSWVVTFLVAAVACFPLGALTAAIAMLLDDGRHGDAVVLLVAMAMLGIVAAMAIRLVHHRSPVTPLALLGIVPAAAAAIVLL